MRDEPVPIDPEYTPAGPDAEAQAVVRPGEPGVVGATDDDADDVVLPSEAKGRGR